eukprot:scaffold53744_cov84-Phaeocystis_antarctica.AAC.3
MVPLDANSATSSAPLRVPLGARHPLTAPLSGLNSHVGPSACSLNDCGRLRGEDNGCEKAKLEHIDGSAMTGSDPRERLSQQVQASSTPREHAAAHVQWRIIKKTAPKDVARGAVEVIEVAKASLDHGEQMLAIARQKAPRLASIEDGSRRALGRRPLAHARATIERRVSREAHSIIAWEHSPSRFEYSRRSLRANVKSSMTHQSREQYVGPATTSSVWQPARKTGKQASDCWILHWSMHALSCGTRRGARTHKGCMRWVYVGRAPPARVSVPCRSSPGAASPSATRPRAWRRAPPSHHSKNGLERRSPPPSPPAPCARGASALLVAQPCCRRGPRRAAGWQAGTGGASRRVRARRRDCCRRRALRPPPPLPPRSRARPGAPGGGGCGHGCGAWRGRRTGGR